jgi:N-acetylglucosamine kinase-like BadF-type ATPase
MRPDPQLPPGITGAVLAGDIGRTTCRLARYVHGVRVADAQGACGVSLSDRDGVAGVHRAVLATLPLLARGTPEPRPQADHRSTSSSLSVLLGITGAAQRPGAARALGSALETDLGVPVTVVSDVVAGHAGAFGGRSGVLTIAGTGAVSLGIGATGAATLVDGWGPLLGDAGSAVDVGRRGLAAALRAHDGRRGGSRALADVATARFGELDDLPSRVQGDAWRARLVASFATDVAAAARAGDAVANDIFATAVEHLIDTTLTAARSTGQCSTGPVGVVFAGGMFALDDLVAAPVRAALAGVDLVEVRAAAGDALDGAHAMATGAAGLHHELRWIRPGAVGAPLAARAAPAGAATNHRK